MGKPKIAIVVDEEFSVGSNAYGSVHNDHLHQLSALLHPTIMLQSIRKLMNWHVNASIGTVCLPFAADVVDCTSTDAM